MQRLSESKKLRGDGWQEKNMRQRLADYVADFLVKKGITDCFMVVGGGAMHLNDALGHKEGLHCTYNHHEQACAMAAEAYARVNNRIAAVCVTTGPGGTNALTGVLGGWLDSIPMLVVSGQVRYDTTARYMQQFTNGLPIRAVGDQEFDITKAAASMCKYAVMLEKPEDIRYILERAYHLATTGRRGPSWVDIPVDFQGLVIETEHLRGYHPAEENAERMTEELENVKTGQVTYAVRDTVIDDKEIKQGDYMGIGDKSILAVGKDIKSTTEDMVAEMVDEESAIICIYYGEEVTEEDANALGAALEEKYPEVEVEIHFGGQPIYYYVISVE